MTLSIKLNCGFNIYDYVVLEFYDEGHLKEEDRTEYSIKVFQGGYKKEVLLKKEDMLEIKKFIDESIGECK